VKTSYVRKVDQLGRIVLPKEIRDSMRIFASSELEIFKVGEKIYLTKHVPGCIFCSNNCDLLEFKNKKVCSKCINDFKI